MLAQPTRRVRFGRFLAYTVVFANIAALAFVSACDKVPLLAPTGSVITLFATSDTVPINGEIEIIATVIENGAAAPPTTPTTPTTPGQTPTTPTTPTTSTRAGAGTPVQNGTLVSFTTTIGRIEPREARTHNGEVRVRFIAGGQSGTARITAFSGGAVGTLENLRVGSAAAERVLLSATPQSLCGTGGTTQIAARVENTSGSPVPGVPVTFTSDNGTLSSGAAVTDESGTATVTLTTARETKVTANVAGKTAEVTVRVNARTGVTITPPTTQVSAGVPATFTVGVATGAVIRDVTVEFGDGDRIVLGPITGSVTVNHTYRDAGTFTVRATATDAVCGPETVSTALTILPGQPPAVTITASNNNPTVGETVIFTATVSGATSTILKYEWNFGAGAFPQTQETTGGRGTTTYTTTGSKVITVRVIQAAGPAGEGSTAIVVRAGG
jgi:hypothetical protein